MTTWQWNGTWYMSLQCFFVFCLLQFDLDYEEFKQSIDGLKQQLQMFVDSWFEKPLSVSVLFHQITLFLDLLPRELCGCQEIINRMSTNRVLPRFSFVLASCSDIKLLSQEHPIFSSDLEGSRAPAKIPKHSRSSIVSPWQVPEDSSAVWQVWSH